MSTVTHTSLSTRGDDLKSRFSAVRAFTSTLCETLSAEDCCLQSMSSCSPTRWHLAHTSWFFETFLLKADASYRVFDEHYEVLFNSYYNSVGEQFPRARRGLLSRPSLADVQAYREHIDAWVERWFASGRIDASAELTNIIEWGIQHEQQHQELILTDIKHLFSLNPLFPAYRAGRHEEEPAANAGSTWLDFEPRLCEIGFDGDGFAYDNESPRHRVYVDRFSVARHPVTNGEYLEFMRDNAYSRPEFWLSEGWAFVQSQSLTRPIYWFEQDGQWREFTLAGLRPLDMAAPVSHVSYFEADAFARWAGARLPTEAEWEIAAEDVAISGNFVDTLIREGRAVHPAAGLSSTVPTVTNQAAKMFGDVWEWTASPYTPYPGYAPPSGALGEYNGKFMCNQYVLRGGSCATPSSHIRRTYRNFFPADTRWQFAGIRLAR
jgi:ergothioneine biosynthesis protein EgtB